MSPSSPLSADVRALLHDRLDTLLEESETIMGNETAGNIAESLPDNAAIRESFAAIFL